MFLLKCGEPAWLAFTKLSLVDVVAGAFGSAISQELLLRDPEALLLGPKLRFWDSRGLIVNKGMYFLYFLESQRERDFVYVGVTRNLLRRLGEHNLGRSKSTKAKRPLELAYFEAYKTRSEAGKREYYFKRDYGGVRLKKEIVKTVRRLKAKT